MKVLIYTIDMVEGVERLMPWRTVYEVTKGFATGGHVSAVCSAQGVNSGVRIYKDVSIFSIDYGTENLRAFIAEGGWNLLF